jgi:hypothetical protein
LFHGACKQQVVVVVVVAMLQTLISGYRGDEYFIAWQQITQVAPTPMTLRLLASTAPASDNAADMNSDGTALQVPLPDVMFGGGRAIFTDASVNNRTLLQLAVDRGCSYISTSAQLARVLADPEAHASAPLLGLFAPNHMPYAIDKGEGPTLTDMVNAALAVLKAKGKPFVLFVEGSRIDHALHDNDAAAAAAEVLAYDDAFAAAVHFADGAKGTGSGSPTTVIRFVFIRVIRLSWESSGFGSICALAAHSTHLTPHTSHLTPHTSHLTPHTSHLTPHTPHLTPHTSHLTPHTSHLTPHTSHLTPHTSHLTPHTSHLTPFISVADHSTGGITLGAQLPGVAAAADVSLLLTCHAAASGDTSCYPPYEWDAARLTRCSSSSSSLIVAVSRTASDSAAAAAASSLPCAALHPSRCAA